MSKEEFKILDAREHVRLRAGMYVGSTSLEEHERFLNGVWTSVSYVPAIVKMVDEIIDNSIDESIRTNFKFSNRIFVTVGIDGFITVSDNGRGIPLDMITTPEGEKLRRPVAAWTRTNAGTSFDDDRTTIGANGLGSAAVNFMSSEFFGSTGDAKTRLDVSCKDGVLKSEKEYSDGSRGTTVKFKPDFSLFGINDLSGFELSSIVVDRLKALSVSFPKIRFFFNENEVTTTIKNYAYQFLEKNNTEVVINKSNDFEFFITSSNNGYRTTSYVNGVNTRLGGSIVDNIVNGIADELILLVKKKHKIDINRSIVKSCLTFVSFARNFVNPKFDSQTKERLTNTQKEVSVYLEYQKLPTYDKLAKNIFDIPELIDPIIEAQLAKKLAADKRAAKAAQKKLKKVKVAKHVPATKAGGTLFICEGESALGFGVDVRDPNIHGFYPLKGVVMNTWNSLPKKVLENKELGELIAILGLDLMDPDSYTSCDYGTVSIMTDADVDGSHIAILLIGFFHKFWPGLIEEGRLKWLRTPIMISSKGKDVKWFYSYTDAKKFKESFKGWSHRYIKGLASLEKAEYKEIINNPVFSTISLDDVTLLENMLGDDPDARKEWING